MGKKIADFYNEAHYLGGLEAKIKLAALTRIPSNRAQTEPDTAEVLSLFESAMVDLRKTFARPLSPQVRRTSPGILPTARLLPGSEELLLGVLSSLKDAVFALFDASGRSAWAWASQDLGERFGAEANEDVNSIGESIAQLIARECQQAIAGVADGGENVQHEINVEHKGVQHWLVINLSPIHDAVGRVSAVAAFVQDVTDRKISEERLRASENRLREHNKVFLELVADKSMFLGDLGKTLIRITEAATHTLDVARASVWFYDDQKTKIVCANLYERQSEQHSSGTELLAQRFPAYFQALLEERTIAADDALSDPRTSEFSESYLQPLGIRSMLDVPIWVDGEMLGVVCHEHIGSQRAWTADEINFAYLMANFIALAKERAHPANRNQMR